MQHTSTSMEHSSSAASTSAASAVAARESDTASCSSWSCIHWAAAGRGGGRLASWARRVRTAGADRAP
jgi:hypothetical protein